MDGGGVNHDQIGEMVVSEGKERDEDESSEGSGEEQEEDFAEQNVGNAAKKCGSSEKQVSRNY